MMMMMTTLLSTDVEAANCFMTRYYTYRSKTSVGTSAGDRRDKSHCSKQRSVQLMSPAHGNAVRGVG